MFPIVQKIVVSGIHSYLFLKCMGLKLVEHLVMIVFVCFLNDVVIIFRLASMISKLKTSRYDRC